MKAKFTPKQRLFITEYVGNGFNGTQAAIKAGYSEKTAAAMATENLQKPHIAKAIEEAVRAKLKDVDRLTVKWLDETCRLAFSDFRDVVKFDANGVEFKDSDQLTDDAARSIETVESSVTYSKNGEKVVNRKIRLHNKAGALAMLGKYLGTQTDQPPPTTPGEAQDVDARRERIAYLQSKLGAGNR